MNKQPRSKCFFLFTICIFYSFLSFTQSSITDSLEQLLATEKDDAKRMRLYHDLSKIHVTKDIPKALVYAQSGLELAEKLNHDKAFVDLNYHLVKAHANSGDFQKALDHALLMKAKAFEMQDTVRIMEALSAVISAYTYLNNRDDAIKESLEFEKLAIATEDYLALGILFTNLGVMNSGNENNEKALEYHLKAHANFEKVNDRYGLTLSNSNLGSTYLNLEDYEKGIQYSEAGVKICQETENDKLLVLNYFVLATNYERTGQRQKAKGYFEKTIEVAEQVGDNEYLCRTFLNLSVIAAEEGNHFVAKGYLDKALPYVEAVNIPKFWSKYYHTRVKVLKSEGNFEQALEDMILANNWEDSLHLEQKNSEFEEIQTKYETEKKEQENQLLTQQNDFLASQNQLYTYIGIGLALIIAILSWLFYKLKKQNQIIQTQKSKLEALNATKDRLFAIIAHDMRNAVHSFRDVTDSIGYFIRKKQPERIMKIAGAVEKSIDQLGRLLDNLLEWALVKRGDMPYQPELLNLTEAIQGVLENFEGMAQRKEVILETDIDANTQIFADKNALETIVRNLVSNALKYSNSGGKVKVSATPQHENALIEIQDNGIGMTSEQKSTLFQPSKNKSQVGTAGEKGSGLGLVLVKELVELNKGNIEVETAEGEGTRFVFSVPKAA